jgi:hypothetical protein
VKLLGEGGWIRRNVNMQRGGDFWNAHFSRGQQRVLALDWTEDEWKRWLCELTPRQLVVQMAGWEVLRRTAPSLGEDFLRVIDLARRRLIAIETQLTD